MKWFIYISIPFLLTSCSGAFTDGLLDLRKTSLLDFDPPPGPPEYRKGWKDGCITGYGSYVDRFYAGTNSYGWRQDPELKDNPMYYRVWKDAFYYCTFFADNYRDKKL